MSILNQIANPVVPKLDDPMEKYGQYLQNALAMDKIAEMGRERESANAMNTHMKAAFAGGKFDPGVYERGVALGGQGSTLPDWWKRQEEINKLKSESAENQATAGKTGAEATKIALENFTKSLNVVSTPQQYVDFASKDPILGKYFSERGITPDKLAAALSKMNPPQFEEFKQAQLLGAEGLKNQYELVKTETGQQLLAVPASGTTRNPQVVGNYGPAPKRAGVTVNMPGAPKAVGEFEKEMGTLRARAFAAHEASVGPAQRTIDQVRKIRAIIGKAFTGKGAGFKTDAVAWARSLGLTVPDDKVIASQMLNRYLQRNLLSVIGEAKQQGASLTPMSNLDLNLIRESSAAQDIEPEAIDALLAEVEDAANRTIAEYNRQRSQFEGTGTTSPAMNAVPHVPVGSPPSGGGSAPPARAVEYLRKNPGTAQQFDAKYGAGAAQRALGGTQSGGAPFGR